MATKIILYIGADNVTKRINEEYKCKVEKILARYWEGFTLKKCDGYYKGEVEESLEAVIIVLKLVFKDLEDCVNDLKVELVQESIGVEIIANVEFKLK
ncbi:hypothetical protein HYX13_04045 [Candidatus Woesearchaeota archaeon]|nr:hypothetical protein [Candidatus Woesearchaeota archaeon]